MNRAELGIRIGVAATAIGLGAKIAQPEYAHADNGSSTTLSVSVPDSGPSTPQPVLKNGFEVRAKEAAVLPGTSLEWTSIESGQYGFESRVFVGPEAQYQVDRFAAGFKNLTAPELKSLTPQSVVLSVGEDMLNGNASDKPNTNPDSTVIRVVGVYLQADGAHVRVDEYKNEMGEHGIVHGPNASLQPGELGKFELPKGMDPKTTKIIIERADGKIFQGTTATISVAVDEQGQTVAQHESVDVTLQPNVLNNALVSKDEVKISDEVIYYDGQYYRVTTTTTIGASSLTLIPFDATSIS